MRLDSTGTGNTMSSSIFKAPVGYVVIPHANNAVHKVLGQYHTISFLPDSVIETLDDESFIAICADSSQCYLNGRGIDLLTSAQKPTSNSKYGYFLFTPADIACS
jgi:hypothetical protein